MAAYQSTFGGGKLPLKQMPERKLTPGTVTYKLYRYLKGCYKPVTEAHIKTVITFKDHKIDNRLRELRKWGYVEDIKQPSGPQLWRTII